MNASVNKVHQVVYITKQNQPTLLSIHKKYDANPSKTVKNNNISKNVKNFK